MAGAKALAASVVDCFTDPQLVSRAKAKHAEETAGKPYRPLLPPDQKPPKEANKELMDAFRPRLAAHHLDRRPEFE